MQRTMATLGRLTILLGGLAGLISPPGQARAVEVGMDAGVGVQENDAGDQRVVYVNLPGAQGIDGNVFQTFRAAFPIGNLSAIEVAPGFSLATYSSNPYGSQSYSVTETRLALGVSYLRGRWEGKGAAPYARIGAQARLVATDGRESSQSGIIVGGGLRWRLGKVIGLRSELSVGRWPWGDSIDHWTGQLSVGVSAFTN